MFKYIINNLLRNFLDEIFLDSPSIQLNLFNTDLFSSSKISLKDLEIRNEIFDIFFQPFELITSNIKDISIEGIDNFLFNGKLLLKINKFFLFFKLKSKKFYDIEKYQIIKKILIEINNKKMNYKIFTDLILNLLNLSSSSTSNSSNLEELNNIKKKRQVIYKMINNLTKNFLFKINDIHIRIEFDEDDEDTIEDEKEKQEKERQEREINEKKRESLNINQTTLPPNKKTSTSSLPSLSSTPSLNSKNCISIGLTIPSLIIQPTIKAKRDSQLKSNDTSLTFNFKSLSVYLDYDKESYYNENKKKIIENFLTKWSKEIHFSLISPVSFEIICGLNIHYSTGLISPIISVNFSNVLKINIDEKQLYFLSKIIEIIIKKLKNIEQGILVQKIFRSGFPLPRLIDENYQIKKKESTSTSTTKTSNTNTSSSTISSYLSSSSFKMNLFPLMLLKNQIFPTQPGIPSSNKKSLVEFMKDRVGNRWTVMLWRHLIRIVIRDQMKTRPLGRWIEIIRLSKIRKEYSHTFASILKPNNQGEFVINTSSSISTTKLRSLFEQEMMLNDESIKIFRSLGYMIAIVNFINTKRKFSLIVHPNNDKLNELSQNSSHVGGIKLSEEQSWEKIIIDWPIILRTYCEYYEIKRENSFHRFEKKGQQESSTYDEYIKSLEDSSNTTTPKKGFFSGWGFNKSTSNFDEFDNKLMKIFDLNAFNDMTNWNSYFDTSVHSATSVPPSGAKDGETVINLNIFKTAWQSNPKSSDITRAVQAAILKHQEAITFMPPNLTINIPNFNFTIRSASSSTNLSSSPSSPYSSSIGSSLLPSRIPLLTLNFYDTKLDINISQSSSTMLNNNGNKKDKFKDQISSLRGFATLNGALVQFRLVIDKFSASIALPTDSIPNTPHEINQLKPLHNDNSSSEEDEEDDEEEEEENNDEESETSSSGLDSNSTEPSKFAIQPIKSLNKGGHLKNLDTSFNYTSTTQIKPALSPFSLRNQASSYQINESFDDMMVTKIYKAKSTNISPISPVSNDSNGEGDDSLSSLEMHEFIKSSNNALVVCLILDFDIKGEGAADCQIHLGSIKVDLQKKILARLLIDPEEMKENDSDGELDSLFSDSEEEFEDENSYDESDNESDNESDEASDEDLDGSTVETQQGKLINSIKNDLNIDIKQIFNKIGKSYQKITKLLKLKSYPFILNDWSLLLPSVVLQFKPPLKILNMMTKEEEKKEFNEFYLNNKQDRSLFSNFDDPLINKRKEMFKFDQIKLESDELDEKQNKRAFEKEEANLVRIDDESFLNATNEDLYEIIHDIHNEFDTSTNDIDNNSELNQSSEKIESDIENNEKSVKYSLKQRLESQKAIVFLRNIIEYKCIVEKFLPKVLTICLKTNNIVINCVDSLFIKEIIYSKIKSSLDLSAGRLEFLSNNNITQVNTLRYTFLLLLYQLIHKNSKVNKEENLILRHKLSLSYPNPPTSHRPQVSSNLEDLYMKMMIPSMELVLGKASHPYPALDVHWQGQPILKLPMADDTLCHYIAWILSNISPLYN